MSETPISVVLFQDALRGAVESASGWSGLVVVLGYSLLVATMLPMPIQLVLLAPLDLGVSLQIRLGFIVIFSAVGTTIGSVLAFFFGQQVKTFLVSRFGHLRTRVPDRVDAAVERLRSTDDAPDSGVSGWLESRATYLVRRYGYFGVFMALSIPMFPHKTTVYTTSILDDNYSRFTLAVFGGAVGRLVVSLALAGGVLTVI